MTATRIRVSEQMRSMLEYLADPANPPGRIAERLLGRVPRPHRAKERKAINWQPMTATERASFSRSKRRLFDLGFVKRAPIVVLGMEMTTLRITPAGRKWLVAAAEV